MQRTPPINFTAQKLSQPHVLPQSSQNTNHANDTGLLQTYQQPPPTQPNSVSASEEQWQFATSSKKRYRNSPPEKREAKQTKISEYWLNPPISTSNKFKHLSNEEVDSPIGDNAPQVLTKNTHPPKPPPMYME